MSRYIKDKDAVLDYKVDWSGWLATGETIATSIWIVPDGVTKDSEVKTTTNATVWLSGGADGGRYLVTNRITTDQGRVDDRSILIVVRER